MLKKPALLTALAVLAACASEPGTAATPPEGTAPAALAGATIGPDGKATILDAPPAPFTPAAPGTPEPLSPEQIAGQQQFQRAGAFQNKVMGEVQALADRLRRAQKGNFVDLYFENEGEPHVVFRFLRNPQATLARYTKNPSFRAARAGFSSAEVKAAADFMWKTFEADRVVQAIGMGNKRGMAEIEISVTEAEFRALAARKGVRIPEAAHLQFRATTPAQVLNRPLAPDIAPLVRIFPRSDRPLGMLHAINSRAKVVLDNGCFRIAGGAHDRALVLFPLGAQLFKDSGNYLAYGSGEVPGYARVGEELVFPGSIGEVTAPDLVRPIHAACGAGKVVEVTATRSAAAEAAQRSLSQNGQTLRELTQSYGLSEAAAQRVLARCAQRMGTGYCMIPPPPPPPPGGPACPPGTKASYGMCRTPEGFIRPLPGWIEELMKAP